MKVLRVIRIETAPLLDGSARTNRSTAPPCSSVVISAGADMVGRDGVRHRPQVRRIG